MVSGILSTDAIGRTDISKYYNGVAEATNMVVEPLGGLKKRVGFEYLGNPGADYRLFEFLFNTDDKYVVLLGNEAIKIWDIMVNDWVDDTIINIDVGQAEIVDDAGVVTTPYKPAAHAYTTEQAKQVDFVQSADTMIITHGDIRPQKLVRYRDNDNVVTEWKLEVIELTNIPQYNWEPSVGAHDSGASRVLKAEDNENDILRLRDEITNAISLGEGLMPRIESTETETITLNVSAGEDIITTTTTNRAEFEHPADDAHPEAYDRWGIKTVTEKKHSAEGDVFESTTVIIWDKPMKEIIDEAVRNRISLKDSNYSLLTQSQLEALIGEDFTDEINDILTTILGDYDDVSDADYGGWVDNVWGVATTRTSQPQATVNVDRGWPRYCTFYQNRLFFAGTPKKPMSIWGSVVNDFFNFDISESDADYGIADTLNANTLNHITGIFPAKVLQIYTSGAEYVNISTPITPTTSNWVFQTGMGSRANVSLDSLDGSTLFIDRSSAIREFTYNYEQDNYIAKNIALLARQVIRNPSQVVIVRSSQIDLAKLVYFLNEDGSLAILNIDNNEKILAWTEWNTEGEIIQIVGVDQSLFILVKRNNEYLFELLGRAEFAFNNTYDEDKDIYLDSSFVVAGTSTPGEYEHIPTDITVGDRFNGTKVTVMLDEYFHDEFPKDTVDVNGNVVVNYVENGVITVDRTFAEAKIGYMFNGTVKTLPLSNPKYANQLEYKRIIKIIVNLFESSGVELDGQYVTDRNFDEYNLGTTPEVMSGMREVYVLGWDKLKDFSIESNYPYKFHILSFTSVIDSNGLV